MNRFNVEKKFLTLVLVVLMSNFSYAAGNVRGKVNEILADYVAPVFIVFLLVAAIVGIIRNFELIEDKGNDGTRMRGFSNVGMLLLYVFVAEIVVGAIVALAVTIKLQI
ncbi:MULTISPECIES: hypothetical protein [unclassified Chryseobacterium]|uniref:hypothetical protein n=1 Tax=unclassified Chryseobacterium TaxID=2593645 RepID=UPI00285335C7|nr:hypothetical protein [Chryseobacterium sp. CFS7]MDR4895104.1 hypothetical protein [Chryseobacterium sp. CFS7]